MKLLPILVTKASSSILKKFGRGGSLPGSIARKLNPNILKELTVYGPVILVTGTNGKTTTANMITDCLLKDGYRVISNRKGDNLREGITTTLLTHANHKGEIQADALVLEVDELTVRHILPNLPVTMFVVNNFFRDQLDRAREMEQLIESIESVLPEYNGTLVLNGNDPNVIRLKDKAKKAKAVYFGIDKNQYSLSQTSEASEGKFCPLCGSRLEYDYFQYSHIGSFHCSKCAFKTPQLDVVLSQVDLEKNTFDYQNETFLSPYEGLYTMYNCAAVFAVCKLLNISNTIVRNVFENAPQPKGRNEHFEKEGKICILNLVKNPTGANEVLKVIEKDTKDKSICIVLNDNDQDGTDISWIYDTFFEKILTSSTKQIICTGSRGYDMALRLYYSGYNGQLSVVEDLSQAISRTIQCQDKSYVIATYTALLPARNVITKEMKV